MSTIDPAAESGDAIQLLTADHEEVRTLFGQYQQLADDEASVEDRVTLATHICFQLLVHAQIEEEMLYPAAEEVVDEETLIEEARAEHDSVRETIVRIESTDPRDDSYDATVLLLAEIVDQHVHEEENHLFPLLRDSVLDLEQLGIALAARRQELLEEVMSEMGEDADD